ncbi:hypothetical protein CON64_09590 [Bacillus pseudomycoides]|nr:hypothetical protein CON64_09590 [Bacillus pseudomycoides]
MECFYCIVFAQLKKWTSLWYCDETNEDNVDKISDLSLKIFDYEKLVCSIVMAKQNLKCAKYKKYRWLLFINT